jgi:hypothetical protein
MLVIGMYTQTDVSGLKDHCQVWIWLDVNLE